MGIPTPIKPLGARRKKTLRIAVPSLPECADIGLSTSFTDNEMFHRNVFEKLIERRADTGEYHLILARSHHTKNKGTTHLFELQQNVEFHRIPGFVPSRTLTAADVQYSLARHTKKRFVDPGFADHKYRIESIIKAIRVIDQHRIAIDTYTADKKPLWELLASPCAVIVSAEYAAKAERENNTFRLSKYPSATGPYVVASSHSERALQLRQHPRYREQTGNVDIIEVVEIPNHLDRYSLLRSSKCHISIAMHHRLQKPLQLRGMQYTNDKKNYPKLFLAIGPRASASDTAHFKQKIEAAIDRSQLNKIHYGGLAKVCNTLIIEDEHFKSKRSTKNNDAIRPDQKDNRKSFKKEQIKLLIPALSCSGHISSRQLALSLSHMLERIGIGIDIIESSLEERFAMIKSGQFDLTFFIQTPVDLSPIGHILELGFSQDRDGTFSEKLPQIDVLIRSFRAASSMEERNYWLTKIDELSSKQNRVIPLLNLPIFDGVAPTVKGFNRGVYNEFDFRAITLS